ncbi:MAG: polysaccharide deacetylase family protein [Clostridia bacterium]
MKIKMILFHCAVLLMVTLNTAANGDLGSVRPQGQPVLNPPEIQTLEISEPSPTPPPPPSRVIDPQKPMVALTFDDGPSTMTLDVMQVLDEYDAKGTFFMVGNRIGRHQSIVAKVAEAGHEIGMHTWNHRELHKLSASAIKDSLQRNSQALQSITGIKPKLLRPPYGTVTKTVRAVTGEMGIQIINWNVDTEDWRNKSTQKIIHNTLSNVTDGAIVLAHDLYDPTTRAVRTIVPELIARGYQLVTVSELLEHRLGGGTAGQVYRQAKPAQPRP